MFLFECFFTVYEEKFQNYSLIVFIHTYGSVHIIYNEYSSSVLGCILGCDFITITFVFLGIAQSSEYDQSSITICWIVVKVYFYLEILVTDDVLSWENINPLPLCLSGYKIPGFFDCKLMLNMKAGIFG